VGVTTDPTHELRTQRTEAELAARVMLATDEFIELFGTGWRRSAPHDYDYDADPSGGLSGPSEPWYVAGEPPQLMLRPHSDALDLAIPHGRWTRGTHGLAYEPDSQRTIWLRDWNSTVVSDVVAYLLKRRRRTFRYCRYCKRQTPPELRAEIDVCMGCAGSVLGVVY
jgi:hypothetical protein